MRDNGAVPIVPSGWVNQAGIKIHDTRIIRLPEVLRHGGRRLMLPAKMFEYSRLRSSI
jgi:hypothetical protein